MSLINRYGDYQLHWVTCDWSGERGPWTPVGGRPCGIERRGWVLTTILSDPDVRSTVDGIQDTAHVYIATCVLHRTLYRTRNPGQHMAVMNGCYPGGSTEEVSVDPGRTRRWLPASITTLPGKPPSATLLIFFSPSLCLCKCHQVSHLWCVLCVVYVYKSMLFELYKRRAFDCVLPCVQFTEVSNFTSSHDCAQLAAYTITQQDLSKVAQRYSHWGSQSGAIWLLKCAFAFTLFQGFKFAGWYHCKWLVPESLSIT